ISEALATAFEHHQAGELPQAEAIYRQVLAVDPNNPDALHLLGLIALKQGHNELAVDCIRRAIVSKPTEAPFHGNLASALKALGKFDEAIACYRRAIELQPDYVSAHYNLATTLLEQRRRLEAIVVFHRVLELKPNHVEALNNLGNALNELSKFDEAANFYRRVLSLQPNHARAWCNLGTVYNDQANLDEAIACFQRVLEIEPTFAAAHCNLGNVYQQLGRFDDAFASYGAALLHDPNCADASFGRSTLRLLLGDLTTGWAEYESRWGTRQLAKHNIEEPLWDGRPLGTKTILLQVEQGFGDILQFIRYAELVKKRNSEATIIVKCQPSIANLLARSTGIDRLVADSDDWPVFDVYAPLASLPRLLQTTRNTIPTNLPYVFADPPLVMNWRERVGNLNGFRIGINWYSGAGQGEFRKRNIPLHFFSALTQIPATTFISLQKGPGSEQLADANDRLSVVDLGPDFDTTHGRFMDTAAVMLSLDLIITSDTSIPHLAGALGVPVWLALPNIPDWRWLLNRSDSPWYPTMRLFRQKTAGDWTSVFSEIEIALRDMINGSRR
ncbi:MAG TPA: tetratricopeptide repeat-containing glycosyltransferase family protein, partial [Pirellulaceae bacterium]